MIQLFNIILLVGLTTFSHSTKFNLETNPSKNVQSELNLYQTKTIKGVFICEAKTPVVNKYDVVILNENGTAEFGKSDLDPSTFMLNAGAISYSNLKGKYTVNGTKISIYVDGDVETYTVKLSSITGSINGIVSSLTGETYSKVK
jgi:hypothetical protein